MNFSKLLVFLLAFPLFANANHPEITVKEKQLYRDELTSRIRLQQNFKMNVKVNEKSEFSYQIKLEKPVYDMPVFADIHNWGSDTAYFRGFWDLFQTTQDSVLKVGNELLPINCVFISAQDNRHIENNPIPLLSEYLMEVYLVVGTDMCTGGPFNPNNPLYGAEQIAWDTYVYYRIKAPTIMQPIDALLVYRKNQYHAVVK